MGLQYRYVFAHLVSAMSPGSVTVEFGRVFLNVWNMDHFPYCSGDPARMRFIANTRKQSYCGIHFRAVVHYAHTLASVSYANSTVLPTCYTTPALPTESCCSAWYAPRPPKTYLFCLPEKVRLTSIITYVQIKVATTIMMKFLASPTYRHKVPLKRGCVSNSRSFRKAIEHIPTMTSHWS